MIKKLLLLTLSVLCMNYNFASQTLQQFQEKLDAEQVEFALLDFHDVESVKTMVFRMYQLDQELRIVFIHDRSNDELQNIMLCMDEFHTQQLKKIIELYGWLTIDKFGEEVDSQAWLLVQHAVCDIEFQKFCLELLEQALKEKQTKPMHYAYLYDRIALKSESCGYQQRYGTQFYIADNGEFIIQNYEGTLEDVDRRRQEMGLSTLAEYRKQIAEVYKK